MLFVILALIWKLMNFGTGIQSAHLSLHLLENSEINFVGYFQIEPMISTDYIASHQNG